MKTPAATRADEVAAALHVALKPRGFRKQARTFNRTTNDGLIQVIGIQLGRSGSTLEGSFTVNLGAYVPEVARVYWGTSKTFASEGDCCVRSRLGDLGPGRKDLWWQPGEAAVRDAQLRLERDGLPFLDRFASRDAVLAHYAGVARNHGSKPPRIVCAIILAERGAKDAAWKLLVEQAADDPTHGHADHVRSLAAKLGLEPLPQ